MLDSHAQCASSRQQRPIKPTFLRYRRINVQWIQIAARGTIQRALLRRRTVLDDPIWWPVSRRRINPRHNTPILRLLTRTFARDFHDKRRPLVIANLLPTTCVSRPNANTNSNTTPSIHNLHNLRLRLQLHHLTRLRYRERPIQLQIMLPMDMIMRLEVRQEFRHRSRNCSHGRDDGQGAEGRECMEGSVSFETEV